MGKHTERLELIAIDKLIPYANNARTHSDEQIKKIQASLREFGFVNPVLIDKDCGIIAGHGRVEAAKREGIVEVPCVWVEHLTDAQKKAYILADNRLAEMAGWDEEMLRIELEELRIAETSVHLDGEDVGDAVERIAGRIYVVYTEFPQDTHLANNQAEGIRCGDNGIFKGMPLTKEQRELSKIARGIYAKYPTDGKYILDNTRLIICQSNASHEDLRILYPNAEINPLGDWTGGTDVDTGATNRKLGSDMADSVTGGGLHGKDLSKADVSVNIYAFLKAQKTGAAVELCCAIGDDFIDGRPYSEIVEKAKQYIDNIGGFEKFAEWGLF